jgi:hypothetical protein
MALSVWTAVRLVAYFSTLAAAELHLLRKELSDCFWMVIDIYQRYFLADASGFTSGCLRAAVHFRLNPLRGICPGGIVDPNLTLTSG